MDNFVHNFYLGLQGVFIVYILFSLYFSIIKKEGLRAFFDWKLISINLAVAVIIAAISTLVI
ncbi:MULTISPECIES: hypothetical protein [Brevibacillus]|jgi:hypothetical protein|uniref:hypothetical protein n=1 Tax=Brevibacillus TaxID=55080 RepID=UPI00048B1FF0|nr:MULTISPECIES: hypothetical protein [Brevibacillus]TRY24429.1 hypothetical protein FOI68_17455 [Brevibacillus sp. LEMMJ03]